MIKPKLDSIIQSVNDANSKRYIGILVERLTGMKACEVNIISYSIDSNGLYTALIEHSGGYRETIHEYHN